MRRILGRLSVRVILSVGIGALGPVAVAAERDDLSAEGRGGRRGPESRIIWVSAPSVLFEVTWRPPRSAARVEREKQCLGVVVERDFAELFDG